MASMMSTDSDSEFHAESSDSDDQDDSESIFGGHAQSILSSLDESIGRIDEYLSFERGFSHGDIVCSIRDPFRQMGRVVDVDVVVDLESSNGEIIKDVNSKKLLKVQSFCEGDYVVCGPWLGKVVRVYDLVTVLLDDGTTCEVSTRDPEGLVAISPSLHEDGPYPYYMGQRVRINCSTSFSSARWFCGAWTGRRLEGTVCRVEVGSVSVRWIASVLSHTSISPPIPRPSCLQSVENLTLLACFPHTCWQLGDWCKLSTDNVSIIPEASEDHIPANFAAPSSPRMNKIRMKFHAYECIYVIVKTKTKVNVLWQDGSYSEGLELESLSPVHTISDHDFWPGQFVLEKATSENPHIGQQIGIVKNVHAQERIVQVKCVDVDSKHEDDFEHKEVTFSAYELIEHPDYSYCLGDIVFRMLPQFEVSTEVVPALHANTLSRNSIQIFGKDDLAEDASFEGNFASHFLSSIGNVIGLTDGAVEVRWASGVTSKVHPSELCGVDKCDVSATASILEEDVIERAADKVITEQGRQFSYQKEKELMEDNTIDSEEDCMGFFPPSSSLLLSCTAVGFLVNTLTKYLGFYGSSSLSARSSNSLKGGFYSSMALPTTETLDALNQLEESIEMSIPEAGYVESDTTNLKISVQTSPTAFIQVRGASSFKKFDSVDDYSDHHFANCISSGATLSQVERSWLRKVQKEWSILEEDLPDTIYVRAYESRIDLLRAAIVGAAGTPYQDTLFFFDICFPPEYPHEPPMVHYQSCGLNLNPNLYQSGKICLSLLKTWSGKGTEVWDPESSTVLQVLLSLQALVLNEKPYFNEAGYDKQIGSAVGEKNSITYNENAFILSRKLMLYQLRNPPKQFEALVEEHYTSLSHRILLTCKAFMDGAQVASDTGCRQAPVESLKFSCSTGFKITLAKLFPTLVSAFTERGIDCSQFRRVDSSPQSECD